MGVTATLPMDFRLAVPGVKFALPFSRRGIVPESASAYFLPRLVGLPKSLEWCYSGAAFLSDEAHTAGLVQSLHARSEEQTSELQSLMRISYDVFFLKKKTKNHML